MSDRLTQLREKLAASKAMGAGYRERVEAIEAEIARLERKP